MATILIVEDHPVTAELLSRQLAKAGHRISRAADGGTALRAAAGEPPDLILLDVGLPDIDGLTVLERLRADPRWRGVAAVVLSGATDARTIRRARELDASFLPKGGPVLPDVLRRAAAGPRRARPPRNGPQTPETAAVASRLA